MKTLKDCGGGQCQMEVQNTEARLAMEVWCTRGDDLSCRFHVYNGLSFAGWGQEPWLNKVFHIPTNFRDGHNTLNCFGCDSSLKSRGIFREWWCLNHLVGGCHNGREDWSGHMAHWYCHVGLCSITARLAAEYGAVDVVLWVASTSWRIGIKTRSKMFWVALVNA